MRQPSSHTGAWQSRVSSALSIPSLSSKATIAEEMRARCCLLLKYSPIWTAPSGGRSSLDTCVALLLAELLERVAAGWNESGSIR